MHPSSNKSAIHLKELEHAGQKGSFGAGMFHQTTLEALASPQSMAAGIIKTHQWPPSRPLALVAKVSLNS
jgi:hypothetical protein